MGTIDELHGELRLHGSEDGTDLGEGRAMSESIL
jgi:hypothetical protein